MHQHNGQKNTYVHFKSTGDYVVDLPFDVADSLISGCITDKGEIYAVEWRGCVNSLREWLRKTEPHPPPHLEVRFKNKLVRKMYKSPVPGLVQQRRRSLGHDLIGMSVYQLDISCRNLPLPFSYMCTFIPCSIH